MQATLVAQITNASPSWRVFIKAEETALLKAVLSKARRYGYLPTDFHSLEDLLDSIGESLFRSSGVFRISDRPFPSLQM